ncbi:MAG: hypothetical protein FWG50_12080, partial [Kiritimatiellaeota bacterium]|nr:hypothetical protein [Kiritimatiellota bacterium]
IYGTNPLDPDSDGDGALDGADPDPLAPYDGPDPYWLFKVINKIPLNAVIDDNLDTDQDGWPDWQEVYLFGTDPGDPLSKPVRHPYGAYDCFKITVTLNAPVPHPGAVLCFGAGEGERRLLLRDTGVWDVWLRRGEDGTITFRAQEPMGLDVDITADDPAVIIQYDPPAPPTRNGEGWTGGDAIGWAITAGAAGVPAITIAPASVCFHRTAPHTFIAEGSAGLRGTYTWIYGRQVIWTGENSRLALAPDFDAKPDHIAVDFLPYGLSFLPHRGFADLHYCALAGGSGAPGAPACPYTSLYHCHGHWCPACGTYDLHSASTHEPPEDPCPECGNPPWSFGDDNCPGYSHDCPFLSELGATNAPDGAFCFRLNRFWSYPDDTATLYPVPGGGGFGCCACPEHSRGNTTAGRFASSDGWLEVFRRDASGAILPTATGSPVAGGEAVHIRTVYPSYAPWDKELVFDWQEHGAAQAFTTRVTVASVRVTPDIMGPWMDPSEFHAAKRALPPEGMHVPAAPGSLTPFRLQDDAYIPCVKTLSLSGDGPFRVWAEPSTNGAPLLECGQTLTNGQPHSFTATGSRFLYLEAPSPGAAAITLAFEGTGAAEGISHADRLHVTAVLPEPELRLQVTPNLPPDSTEDVSDTYRPGYRDPATPMITLAPNGSFQPQQIRLAADLDTCFGATHARFTLLSVTGHPGFCMNKSAPEIAQGGGNDEDFSFYTSSNCTNVSVGVSNGRAIAYLWCKDYGAHCAVRVEFCDAQDNVVATADDEIPRRTPGAPAGDCIAHDWRQAEAAYWQARYPWLAVPAFGMDWDEEPAALGRAVPGSPARTDGSYSHAATGDGLTVWEEYRGYWVDGGRHVYTPGPTHIRLSPVDKELLVQVNELPGMASQPSFNPNNALASYNFDDVMFDVEYFFSHPTRGLGIELLWVRKDFTAFGPPYTPELLPPVTHQERFTGDVRQMYNDQNLTVTNILNNGQSHIRYDNRLIKPPFDTLGNSNLFNQLRTRTESAFIKESRDPLLYQFVKLVLFDRWSNLEPSPTAGTVADIQDYNARVHINRNDPTLEGTHICVASISDEGVTLANVNRHYTPEEFINVLIWAIAHELCHLIGPDTATHYFVQGALMSDFPPGTAGITAITATSAEIADINLKTRHSISQGEQP